MGPTPIPHPVSRRYNLNAHCRYHQGEGHTTDGCHSLRHAIQDLINQQVITLPSSASNPDGYLLNKVHVVFDAFDSSCCLYVHKKI